MDNSAAAIVDVTTVLIPCGIIAGAPSPAESPSNAKAVFANPARVRAVLATIELAAASIADDSTVAGAIRVVASPRCADRRRPNAEAILANPARLGAGAAAMESSAAPIADITTILIAGRVGAGARRARHIGLADVVLADRAHPRTYGRAVERAATPITDGPTVVAIIAGRMIDTGNWHASIKPRPRVNRIGGIWNLRRVGGQIRDCRISRRCIGNARIDRAVRLGLRATGIQRAVSHVGSNHIGNRRAGIVAGRSFQRPPAAPQEASEKTHGKTGHGADLGIPPTVHAQ
jgi:hypothetical protein